MTIGPLPISRIVSRSSLRGTSPSARLHALRRTSLGTDSARRAGIRTRFRGGTPARCSRWRSFAADPFRDVAVVQVQVRDDASFRKRVGVDGVVVVLARDLDPAGREVPHRMVAAVVTEAQLERLRAEGEAHDLVRGRCRTRERCPGAAPTLSRAR